MNADLYERQMKWRDDAMKKVFVYRLLCSSLTERN
jgi:hypothetical protein